MALRYCTKSCFILVQIYRFFIPSLGQHAHTHTLRKFQRFSLSITAFLIFKLAFQFHWNFTTIADYSCYNVDYLRFLLLFLHCIIYSLIDSMARVIENIMDWTLSGMRLEKEIEVKVEMLHPILNLQIYKKCKLKQAINYT